MVKGLSERAPGAGKTNKRDKSSLRRREGEGKKENQEDAVSNRGAIIIIERGEKEEEEGKREGEK